MLFATPWWVNLLLLVPVISFLSWRNKRLALTWATLAFAAAFAVAFGFVEAAVVDYLRGNIPELMRQAAAISAPNDSYLQKFPQALLHIETIREAATMVMLVSVALLAAPRGRERWAIFLWCFAWWDATYYLGLWVTINWPTSLRNLDVLFLIPQPWYAEVWYPLLVCGLTLAAVILGKASAEQQTVLTTEVTAQAFSSNQVEAEVR